MRWTRGNRSEDLEDRRGESPGGGGPAHGRRHRPGRRGRPARAEPGLRPELLRAARWRGRPHAGAGGRGADGAAAQGLARRGAGRRLHVLRPRRRAEHVGPRVHPPRPGVRAGQARALHRRGPLRLRRGGRRGRALLLPRGPEGLHRPGLLQRPEEPVRGAGRLRPGLRAGPRDRPPRPAPPGHHRAGPRAAGPARSRQRAVGAPRAAGRLPGRASGRTPPTSGGCSRKATSRRPWGPPPRWATTASRSRPAAASRPRAGPTARPASARAGSGAGSSRARCRTATRSAPPCRVSRSEPRCAPADRRGRCGRLAA